MPKILILNGPNLNLLGRREPEIYGHQTLDDIETLCVKTGRALDIDIDFRQSNHEGALVDWIQKAIPEHSEHRQPRRVYRGLIINAAAYTHTSIAIHDALKALDVPIIEVHLSDPAQREDFRHHSFIEPLANKVFKGLGAQSYIDAITYIAGIL